MNTPNPLIPQGSLQSRQPSNVRLAVISIVAVHVVFFGGLLLQGCKRDATTGGGATNTIADSSPLTSPATDTNYYSSATNLPAPAEPVFSAAPAPVATSSVPAFDYSTTGTVSSTSFTPTVPAGATSSDATQHTIKKGDTYSKIAKANGIAVSALTKANPGVDPARLKIGQKLTVPPPAPKEVSATTSGDTGSGSTYTVVAGDTLTRIAKKHGTTVSALRAANGMKVSMLKVGQKIKLPAPGSGASVPAPAPAQPAVQSPAPAEPLTTSPLPFSPPSVPAQQP